MLVKLSTKGIFSTKMLVRVCPIVSVFNEPKKETICPVDISSSDMVLDIESHCNYFSYWKDTIDPDSKIRLDDIYNFSDNEEVFPISVYDKYFTKFVDIILIPFEDLEKSFRYYDGKEYVPVVKYSEEYGNQDLEIPVEILANLIKKYSVKFFTLKREIENLNKIYSNKFLSGIDFSYKDYRISKE